MRVLAILSLALLALAFVSIPTSNAASLPPPCGDAYCCIPPSCGPVILRCPSETVGTDTVNALVTTGGLIVVTADAEATMGSNCATHECVATNMDCNATTCGDFNATCCDTALVAAHSCTCQESPISPPVAVHLPPTAIGTTAVALPVPHVSAHGNRDCTVTVVETYDCPAGFWDTTSYLTLGPIHFVIDGCAPMCACMPIEVATASDPTP